MYQIWCSIPWEELIESFGMEASDDEQPGPCAYFDAQGRLALMFLKHYTACSDGKLLEQLNGNLHWQFFCRTFIVKPLTHRQLVSKIRCNLADRLLADGSKAMHKAQEVMARYWKPYMEDPETVLMDATCYESDLRYPTDVKLLWESLQWLHRELKGIYKRLRRRMPRTKYKKWATHYETYRRQRKPRIQRRRSITRALLRLIDKYLGELRSIEEELGYEMEIQPTRYRKTIEKVYEQQYAYFHEHIKPKHRIVSLSKSYIRPIVRGKENKSVEFGAKVNKLQIGGLNFIEYVSFHNFHEGNRLKKSVSRARKLVGKVSRLGGDRHYSTNANRTYCRKQNIFPDFKRKGPPGKDEDQAKILRKAITKERATRLEGSFGNEKNHYHLRRIKAKTLKTEILWIFFGIHTANAVKIAKRRELQDQHYQEKRAAA